MWYIIAKKEIRESFQNRVFLFLTAILWILLLLASIGGLSTFHIMSKQQSEANSLFKNQLAEKERNPHAAAHFGTYLFKPVSLLGLYDPGVNNYAGTMFRVEAHKQSEMNLAAVKDSEGMMRFGELSIASIFQLFVPLMIIFLSFPSISKERENGNLKLLLAQGLTLRSLLWGKIWGNYGLLITTVLPAFALILFTGLSNGQTFIKVTLFISFYALYFLICTCIAVGISNAMRNSAISLLALLCIWIWIGILSPKFVATIARARYPLPSYYEFSKLISNDFYNGLNHDGTYAQRREKLERAVLARYKVDSVKQLPINLDGLMMQDAEDYNSRVYRFRSFPIAQQMRIQKQLFSIASFFSPYIAIKQLSMGIAGTDLYRHQDFHHQAGIYRDRFVRTLNMELSKANHQDGRYVVSTGFLNSMEQFRYRQPSIMQIIQQIKIAVFSLVYWLFLTVMLLEFACRKFSTE